VSLLKKQGLLPARSDSSIKIDARSVIPSMKVKGKRLDSIVKKYDSIVSGKATALPVAKKDLAKFRRAGFETSQSKVIVPHAATEKAKLIKGQVTIKGAHGIERVQIPVPFHNLRQYLADIKRNHKTINTLKEKREVFGIRFYGGQRANFYSDIRALVDDLNRYEAIRAMTTKYKQEEIYQHLEILRMNRSGAAQVERHVEERKRTMSKEYNRRHAKRARAKIKRDPERAAQYRAAAADRAKTYRARRKSPAQLARMRAKAKARQAKFRAKHRKAKSKKRTKRGKRK